ncbi:hypothetical protein [Ralstonia pickettii]|uniref:hypothetical protein n=1 Tax=Ralstonia pickettii TaxID=329 RepID=UPI0015F85AA0|nr:hypothetical protein [Ralstonia pickettii]MBX4003644.1 hypothetical protein [Ralstonia pickettii]MBX4030263.1 hypothetical protein [Ralstonia pickettii]MBX4072080.1 hypothetical protein [Ralstonia pickettii]MBX4077100.1 hypothetical protein [Ralstonia pickettii]MBX4089942.1 hypothetical protein [Ralstonia pickettii]
MDLKTKTLNLWVSPELKDLAVRNHRTIANFIEGLVREHCEKFGVAAGPELIKQPLSRL